MKEEIVRDVNNEYIKMIDKLIECCGYIHRENHIYERSKFYDKCHYNESTKNILDRIRESIWNINGNKEYIRDIDMYLQDQIKHSREEANDIFEFYYGIKKICDEKYTLYELINFDKNEFNSVNFSKDDYSVYIIIIILDYVSNCKR